MALKIGEVAYQAGVSVETIRYYERLGVIAEASRSSSGYRRFDPEAVREVGFVKRAQELGFSLEEIRELLQLCLTPTAPATMVRQRAETKLVSIEAKIADLERMRDALHSLTQACCGTGPIGDCAILDALETSSREEQHAGRSVPRNTAESS